jgi:hypothetical protein
VGEDLMSGEGWIGQMGLKDFVKIRSFAIIASEI